MSLKPPYLALIEHIVKEHAAGKLKLDLATEIETGLFTCGFRIVAAKERGVMSSRVGLTKYRAGTAGKKLAQELGVTTGTLYMHLNEEAEVPRESINPRSRKAPR